MPWNHCLGEADLPAANTPERVQQLESEMQGRLDEFAGHVLKHQPYVKPDTDVDLDIPRWIEALNALIPRSLNYGLHRYMYQDLIHFYSDTKCNGCGICERVCLSHKIAMADQTPRWVADAKCYGCFACINFCPQQAIQIRSRFPVRSSTRTTGRYHHSLISYWDIAAQR
jgi:ferredoxin